MWRESHVVLFPFFLFWNITIGQDALTFEIKTHCS